MKKVYTSTNNRHLPSTSLFSFVYTCANWDQHLEELKKHSRKGKNSCVLAFVQAQISVVLKRQRTDGPLFGRILIKKCGNAFEKRALHVNNHYEEKKQRTNKRRSLGRQVNAQPQCLSSLKLLFFLDSGMLTGKWTYGRTADGRRTDGRTDGWSYRRINIPTDGQWWT